MASETGGDCSHEQHAALTRTLRPAPPFDVSRLAAPMVGASDLAFRVLALESGASAAYTEMVLATDVLRSCASDGRLARCVAVTHLPTIVQLAGNEPAELAAATAAVAPLFSAVDLNLGCPQDYARAGRYGSYLTDPPDWPLVARIVRSMVEAAGATPVFCKMRLQPSLEGSIAFARMLQAAGCSLLVVHGRTRGSSRDRRKGPADLSAIAAVREALAIPVVSNGNVCCHADVHANAARTGCAGVMSAEGLLRDPAIFSCHAHGCPHGRGAAPQQLRRAEAAEAHGVHAAASELEPPTESTEAGRVVSAGEPEPEGGAGADSCRGALDPPHYTPYAAYSRPQLLRLRADSLRIRRLLRRYLQLVSTYHSSSSSGDAHTCVEGVRCCEAPALGAVECAGAAAPPAGAGPAPLADFRESPALTLDKLLQHVLHMLGKGGHGAATHFRLRGAFSSPDVKAALSEAAVLSAVSAGLSARGMSDHVWTHVGARKTAPPPPRVVGDAPVDVAGAKLAAAAALLAPRPTSVLVHIRAVADAIFASLDATLDALLPAAADGKGSGPAPSLQRRCS
jgi:tRNA-dihydrouridine synthase 1